MRRGARGQPAEAATADGVRHAQGYEAKIMAPIRARFFADTWMFERHAPTPRSARSAHAAAARVSPSRAAARVAVDRRRSCCEKLGAGPGPAPAHRSWRAPARRPQRAGSQQKVHYCRYSCPLHTSTHDVHGVHHSHFVEYPEVLAILTREV